VFHEYCVPGTRHRRDGRVNIIRALDLFRDRIDCGTGNSDTVVYDRNLDTIEDCEIKRPFN
jgi:hypothetical protein